MGDAEISGLWVVISTTGNKEHIGKLTGYTTIQREQAEEDFEKGKSFVLSPVFDFFSPLTPVQQQQGGPMGWQRSPVVTPHGFTTSPKTSLRVHASSILFFDELENDDRHLYESFVKETLQQMDVQRAKRSGLTLAHSLPKQR